MLTMGKPVKTREDNIRGFSLFWRSKNSSSKRTVATMHLMQQTEEEVPDTYKKKTCRRWKKHKSLLNDLHCIPTNVAKCVPFEKADGMTFSSTPNLDIYRTDHSHVHWLDEATGVFSALIIPRERTLQSVSLKNTRNVINALNKLQLFEKSWYRSTTKSGSSLSRAKYTIFGSKVHRGGHGYVHDRLSSVDPKSAQTLERWAQRMEHVAAEFIPSKLLAGVSVANSSSAWPTTGKCKYVSAIASSVNYSAPAHVDDDFLFSIHQLNVDGILDSDDVVQYMCFPTYGYAVGLRPGDILLFNPHVHHCLSKKTVEFSEYDVHVSTFYVKTAHVGKNNNSIPLNDTETMFYNMSF